MDCHLLKQQFFWFILSIVALYIFMAVDYTIIFNYVPIFYWGSVVLLILAKDSWNWNGC